MRVAVHCQHDGIERYGGISQSVGKHVNPTAFYTFSKSLASEQMDGQSTNGGAEDANNLALERGRSDFDQRHTFVAAVIWDLSYYRGASHLMKNLLNGWTLSPIVTLNSGLPFTVTSGKDNNYDGVNNNRVQNPIGTDGTSARNLLDAPNATLSSSTVSQITGAQSMRQLQLGIRLTY